MKLDHPSVANLSPREQGFLLGALLLEMGGPEMPGGAAVAEAFGQVMQDAQRDAIVAALRAHLTEAIPEALGAISPDRLAARLREEPPNIAANAVGFLPECTQVAVRSLLPPLPELSPSALSGTKMHREMMASIFLPILNEAMPEEQDQPQSPESAWETVCTAGAQVLGLSLVGASPAVLARAMAAVGSRWAASVRSASAKSDDEGLRRQAQVIAARVGALLLPEVQRSAEDRLAAMGYLFTTGTLSRAQRNALRMALPTWVDGLEKA